MALAALWQDTEEIYFALCFFLLPFSGFQRAWGAGINLGGPLRWASPHKSCFRVASGRNFSTIQIGKNRRASSVFVWFASFCGFSCFVAGIQTKHISRCAFFYYPFLVFSARGEQGLIRGGPLRWASPRKSCFRVASERHFNRIQIVRDSPSFARFSLVRFFLWL